MSVDQSFKKETDDLVIGYFITGIVIFLLGGTLGLILRLSQAGIIKIGLPSMWYTYMTFHGDAMFIGFGVFCAIGLTYYVLVHALDAPLHSIQLAKLVYWIFMVGVVFIAVGTLVLGFNASWVFLYPLPIPRSGTNFGSGDASVLASTVFLLGVILIGIAIIIYCIEVLLTIRQNGPGVLRGIGIDWFKEPELSGEHRIYKWGDKPFPTAILPITVNAIGMLIATPVFAVLLILMVLEVNGIADFLDALIAKNMLWFFGHPVVYQLLFPIAGYYYYAIGKYSKQPILGQRFVALSWFIATILQNIIWSHHIFIDLVQPWIVNVIMQITTYGITIPSLASLYALVMTIYTGEFEWNITSRFIFTGIVGWFLAGVQAVMNATMWTDKIIHNTLFIPGHLHTMVLFNILMGFFGLVYYLLPKYTGRSVSEKLARWHWLGSLIGLIGMVHFWLFQGLLGYIRRSAVLPPEAWLTTVLSLPFFLLFGISQLIFVYIVWKTVWGEAKTSSTMVASSS